MCALCCHRHTTTVCGACKSIYSVKCIDPHPRGDGTWHSKAVNSHITELDIPLLLAALWFSGKVCSGQCVLFCSIFFQTRDVLCSSNNGR